jgi:type II secretory pathway pseudopilin PulG
MIRHPFLGRPARRERGFTLLSVLIAIFLFGFGLLAIMRSLGSVTGSATQNQNVQAVATFSNGFWGVVQANPALVTDAAFPGTFTSSNITSAPAALRPWLTALTYTGSGVAGTQAGGGLPGGQAKIEVFPDTGTGTACAVASGCSVKLTLTWTQVASTTPNRSQVFYYQFGL